MTSGTKVERAGVRGSKLTQLTIPALLLISTSLAAEPQYNIEPATTSLPVETTSEAQPLAQPQSPAPPPPEEMPALMIELVEGTSLHIQAPQSPQLPQAVQETEATPAPQGPASSVQPVHPEIGSFGDFRSMFGTPSEIEVPSWADGEYDPRPVKDWDKGDELLLPLPCGGAMVFRRIEVGGDPGPLGEQQIELGSPSINNAPLDYRHPEQIAGTFGGESGRRYYYLGKYEVSELQYRAVMGDCPEQRHGRRPAVGVSWHDAVDFTRRYTEWLFEKAPERLPQEDGMRGYLRLPTEVEWEYAARGGLKVDAEAFRHDLFPTGDNTIDEYAWFRESVSSSFEPRPVGSLKPNPLGLYDILGNAAELVFDLFRLNLDGRHHGQAGGFLVKGGHFRSWRKGLRSSWRQEHPHFNPATGRPNRLDTVGFRVLITAPVLTSEQRFKQIRDEWEDRPLPETVVSEDALHCQELLTEVGAELHSTKADLEQCLIASGRATPLPFPTPPPPMPEPPSEMPPWGSVRSGLDQMLTIEIRHYGFWYLQAGDPDKALLLFKQATRQGDAWSALAVGAFYDPLLYEAPDFGPERAPFRRANPELAKCWYLVAESLGEPAAKGRMTTLMARQAEGMPGDQAQGDTISGRCELIMEQYGRHP